MSWYVPNYNPINHPNRVGSTSGTHLQTQVPHTQPVIPQHVVRGFGPSATTTYYSQIVHPNVAGFTFPAPSAPSAPRVDMYGQFHSPPAFQRQPQQQPQANNPYQTQAHTISGTTQQPQMSNPYRPQLNMTPGTTQQPQVNNAYQAQAHMVPGTAQQPNF
ncbi:hypothetical protein H2198_001386 [Neophaeococcomyces mojaviensis]|uniref:Uncharacterized protein n=1 Tax=Neophaeococcomyces mojaviensis TaxID=3383035 RepID=A0ACC3AHC8_9EURO|nr:hypothetical protein H2198_001386 [Knufia sp. JES_112]